MGSIEYCTDRTRGTELLRLLPPVLRARDFHLYLEGGRRLTDLWQMGGMAILGHKPSMVVSELKNIAERGLFTPFPHYAENRFLKALARLFPSGEQESMFCFRIYGSHAALKTALENAGFPFECIADPAFPFAKKKEEFSLSLWRPFIKNAKSSLYIPILPWGFSPQVLVLEKSLENQFPAGDLISPFILAPATRAIYDLLAQEKDRGRPVYIRINKALSRTGNKWQRRGIYLARRPNPDEDWKQLWKRFLEKGFLLPPSPQEPLILPGTLSKGEETKLAELLGE